MFMWCHFVLFYVTRPVSLFSSPFFSFSRSPHLFSSSVIHIQQCGLFESETDVGCLLWVRHRSHCQPVWYCRFAWWGCVRGLGIGSSWPQCRVLEPVTRGTTPSDPLGCKTHCFMFLYKPPMTNHTSYLPNHLSFFFLFSLFFHVNLIFFLIWCVKTGCV